MLKFHAFSADSLRSSDVHLWHVSLEKLFEINKLEDFLDSKEKERAARFMFEIHKQRFKAARIALRLLLSHYLSMPPKAIEFAVGKYGKPFLKGNPLAFNVSHSGNMCLIGFSKNEPLGVDVEAFSNRDYLGISEHSFSKREQIALASIPSNKRQAAFFRIWSQKEAFIKLSGLGLNCSLRSFSVASTPPETLLEVSEGATNDYYMHSFKPDDSSYAAVCAKFNPASVMHYQFQLYYFEQSSI